MAQLIPLIKNQLNHLKNSTLTIRGFIICGVNESNNLPEQKFDWENALIDATITSAVTFFSTLGAGTAAGLDGINGIRIAGIAAFTQFFVFLALKRGIIQKEETK